MIAEELIGQSVIEPHSNVTTSVHQYLGKLTRRINLHASECFLIKRAKMCLIAGHERFAFICNGGGKYPAIILRAVASPAAEVTSSAVLVRNKFQRGDVRNQEFALVASETDCDVLRE